MTCSQVQKLQELERENKALKTLCSGWREAAKSAIDGYENNWKTEDGEFEAYEPGSHANLEELLDCTHESMIHSINELHETNFSFEMLLIRIMESALFVPDKQSAISESDQLVQHIINATYRLKHFEEESTQLYALIADIRKACGDGEGCLMQDELVNNISALNKKAECKTGDMTEDRALEIIKDDPEFAASCLAAAISDVDYFEKEVAELKRDYEEIKKLRDELQSMYFNLKKENDELKAHCNAYRSQIAKLQYRLQERFEWVLGTITQDLQQEYENSINLLKQTPQQCINEIKAQAIENVDVVELISIGMRHAIVDGFDYQDMKDALKIIAEKLRKGGEE